MFWILGNDVVIIYQLLVQMPVLQIVNYAYAILLFHTKIIILDMLN